MPTVDVAPLVTGGTYTPTLLVPTDGTTFTQAMLTSLIVSLGNRIEFLRDLVPEAANDPERSLLIREDFAGAIWTPGQARLDGEFPWRTGGDTGTISVSGHAGSSKNPGQLRVSIPGDGATEVPFYLHPHLHDGDFTSFARFRHAAITVRLNDDVANSQTVFSWGLGDEQDDSAGGDNSIRLCWFKSLDALNWKVLVRNGGVNTIAFSTLTAMTNNEFITLRMSRANETADVEIYVNSSATPAFTIDAADVPVTACNYGAYMSTGAADTDSFQVSLDFLSYRAATPSRQGV
jgi:hypothetical protein